MRISLLPAAIALLPLALAVPASAGGPEFDSGSDSGLVFVADCGDFEIWDDYVTNWSGKVFHDAEGTTTRVVERIWGSDTFVNTTSGDSVSGTFSNGEVVDLINRTVTQNGSNGKITLPGVGLVFIDVGKYIVNIDTGQLTFVKGQHGFINEDYARLCQVLG